MINEILAVIILVAIVFCCGVLAFILEQIAKEEEEFKKMFSQENEENEKK